MLRHLAGDLLQQSVIRDRDHGAASSALEVQGVRPAVLSAQPVQGRAALRAAQVLFQAERRTLRPGCVSRRLSPDVRLRLPEHTVLQDGWIAVPARIAGIFQQAFDLVLVPEGSLPTEWDLLPVERVGDPLISCLSVFCRVLINLEILLHRSVFQQFGVEVFRSEHKMPGI